MRVLVACEYSGAVRSAFEKRGHYALSCDLLPSEDGGEHHQGDVRELFCEGWDLMIGHPPCTHLAVSGARWFKDKKQEQEEALTFVRALMNAPIDMICIENPVSIISSKIRKPDQIIHPWMFGHEVSKKTCLWLKNLPHLEPTDIVGKGEYVTFSSGKRMPAWYNLSPGEDRWKERSRTFQGIANAMAEQWG